LASSSQGEKHKVPGHRLPEVTNLSAVGQMVVGTVIGRLLKLKMATVLARTGMV
jgi:purine nucleoside phosphorylase